MGWLGPYTLFHPPNPGLHTSAFCSTVCIINSYSTLLNWPIVSLLILFHFILFSNVFCCILVHDYALCFIGSPCCSFSCYNFISVWPFNIVIQSICKCICVGVGLDVGICICISIGIGIYIAICEYVCMCVCMYVCMCVCVYVFMYVCMYVYFPAKTLTNITTYTIGTDVSTYLYQSQCSIFTSVTMLTMKQQITSLYTWPTL